MRGSTVCLHEDRVTDDGSGGLAEVDYVDFIER